MVDTVFHGRRAALHQAFVRILCRLHVILRGPHPLHNAAAALAEVSSQTPAHVKADSIVVTGDVDGLQRIEVGEFEAVEATDVEVRTVMDAHRAGMAALDQAQSIHTTFGDEDGLLAKDGVHVPWDRLTVRLALELLAQRAVHHVHHHAAVVAREGDRLLVIAVDVSHALHHLQPVEHLEVGDAAAYQIVLHIIGVDHQQVQVITFRKLVTAGGRRAGLAEVRAHLLLDEELAAAVEALPDARLQVHPHRRVAGMFAVVAA